MSSPVPNPVPPPCITQPGNPKPSGILKAAAPANPRALLTDAQFSGVLATVLDNNPGMDIGIAGRIVVEALKFTVAAARFPTLRIAPTRESTRAGTR